MMRAVICKGDPTSHGGKVLEGNENATAFGRAIAQKGHMTFCPQCKGQFPISEGLSFHTFAGIGTAVEKMKTACGATLIATSTQGTMMIDDGASAGGEAAEPAKAATVVAAGTPTAGKAAGAFRGTFRAVDQASGQPVVGKHYQIDLSDGTFVQGSTDADGYTAPVAGHQADTVRLHWLVEAPVAASDSEQTERSDEQTC